MSVPPDSQTPVSAPESPALRYTVDAADLITSVDSNWDAFAMANRSPGVLAGIVVGTPIWSHIQDLETRHLYQILFTHVRESGRPRAFSFRCDGPLCRRFMRMILAPLMNGGIELTTFVKRFEPRPRVELLDPEVPKSPREQIRMCSWCNKVLVPPWAEIEEAIQILRLFDRQVLPRISHGMCEECEQRMIEDEADA